MDIYSLPLPVVRRLPKYYRQLDDLVYDGVERISSGKLAEMMNITASQVRQDFSFFGKLGQQGYGYNVKTLKNEIGVVLGIDVPRTVALFGMGHLGRALTQHLEFSKYNYSLAAAFEINPDLVGSTVNGVRIYHYNQLQTYLASHRVDAAILAVPRSAARYTAREIVDLGIKFLWNFTNVDLKLPERDAFIEDVHFSDSLLCLSYYMK